MKTETLSEFLARGGKIKNVTVLDGKDQLSRDIVLSARHNAAWLNNIAKLVEKFRAMPMNRVEAELKKLTPNTRRKVAAKLNIIEIK